LRLAWRLLGVGAIESNPQVTRLPPTAKGLPSAGSKVDSHERWTDAWVKMAKGKGQCVARHPSEMKKQAGPRRDSSTGGSVESSGDVL
jgi:hypothetical protein